jgi:hypothetical protein
VLEGKLATSDLEEVRETTRYYLKKSTLSPLAKILFSAYLAEAQKDFAFAMLEKKGSFDGSFTPVTLGIWGLFQPGTLISEYEDQEIDPDSQVIAEKILAKYRERLKNESAQIRNAPVREGPGLFTTDRMPYGLNICSLKPWHLKRCDQFRPPPFEHKATYYKQEIAQIKTLMEGINSERIQKINYWAFQADWMDIARAYMDKQKVPLEVRLNVYGTLSTGLADAMGAAFDAKYAYWISRPSDFDTEIQPIIALPNHPGYPSEYSVRGAAAAVILTRFFPENQREWEALAEEEGMSRVWAGLQFPVDHKEGKALGQKIGREVIK